MVNIKYNLPSEPEESSLGGSSIPKEVRDEAPPIPQPASEAEMETPLNQEETETPQTPAAEKPEEKSTEERQPTLKEFKAMDGARRHFEEENKKLKEELSSLKRNPLPDVPTSGNPMETVRLAKALEGFSEDEISFITRNAEDKSIGGIIKASKDNWVQDAIQAKREKVKKEQSVPEPSSFSRKPGEKEIPKRYSGKEEQNARDILLERLGRKTREEKISGI